MSNKFVYTLIGKTHGTPIQDAFFSRSEAREYKRLYEQRDQEKYTIVRYAVDRKVR